MPTFVTSGSFQTFHTQTEPQTHSNTGRDIYHLMNDFPTVSQSLTSDLLFVASGPPLWFMKLALKTWKLWKCSFSEVYIGVETPACINCLLSVVLNLHPANTSYFKMPQNCWSKNNSENTRANAIKWKSFPSKIGKILNRIARCHSKSKENNS